MGLTVHFIGICTHTKILGGGHRVVLVRADHGANINDHPLPPHIPLLKIDPADIRGIDGSLDGLLQADAGAWRLCGVKLWLGGMTETTLVRDIGEIPHLEIKDVKKEDAPKVSGEVIGNNQAAAYFDLSAGRLTWTKTEPHKAIMSMLEVETGDEPTLQVQCFWNQKTSSIRLVPGATITIEHIGTNQGDSKNDFLFHYRIFERVHENAVVPDEPKAQMNLPPGGVTIGCSNSQYP